MIALLRCELFKLRHRLLAQVLLGIALAGTLLGYLLLAALPGDGAAVENLRLDHVPDQGMFVVYQIGMVAAVALGASTIGTEYGWGTIRALLPRTAGRSPFVAAKLLSLGLFVVAAVVLGLVAALIGAALVTELKGLDGSVRSGFAGATAASAAKTVLAIMPYCALAFVVALWSRSTAAGIAIPIVAFYTEVLLTPVFRTSSALDWLPSALIYNNIVAVLGTHPLLPQDEAPGQGQAAGVLAVYVAGLTALALWRFRTRDIK